MKLFARVFHSRPMNEDSVAECMDCGTEYKYTRPSMRTNTEYLKKRRCRKCGHFALKSKS